MRNRAYLYIGTRLLRLANWFIDRVLEAPGEWLSSVLYDERLRSGK